MNKLLPLNAKAAAKQHRLASLCAIFLALGLAANAEEPANGIKITAATDGQPAPKVQFARQEASHGAAHRAAVKQARAGNLKEALAALEKLRRDHPGDLAVLRDYVAVLSWSDKHKEAIRAWGPLSTMKQPDYVTEAAARSYRLSKRYKQAIALYQRGAIHTPGNPAFPAGEIRTLADSGKSAEAIKLAKSQLQQKGDKVEILLAAAYAARLGKMPVDSVRYCERALRASPNSREAKHDLIISIAGMGVPQVALRMAEQNPGILTAAELRRIEGDVAATLVRAGPHEPNSEAERFVATDRAIASLDKLIAAWDGQKSTAADDVLRARFDRMVAYRDRFRMQDVLNEYESMQKDNVDPPAYVLAAVGDAYLYKRQPKKARDLYMKVLQTDPQNFDVRLQLFYAYVELDDFKAAFAQLDALDKDTAVWIRLKGMKEPLPNPERETVELASGYSRLYSGEYAKAQERVAELADAAPGNSRFRAALGTVYLSRGLPRMAREQCRIGTELSHGKDIYNEVCEAQADFDLQHFRDAKAKTKDLYARFPENLEVQRLEQRRKIHNRAEIVLDAGHAFRSSTATQGGEGTGLEAMVYSPPIFHNWRIFAGQRYAIEKEPNAEGTIELKRSTAGVEFRGNGVTLRVSPTYNLYDDARNSDAQRIGVRGEGSVDFTDRWSAGGHAEMFSRDTPLRALNSGVTADSANLYVHYRQHESRIIRIAGGVMRFSDRNWRTNAAIDYTERLYTSPHWRIDGLINLAEGQNTRDANRTYFNPRQNAIGLGGAQVTHTLYRRYQTVWEHALTAKPGAYWQRFHGLTPTVAATYAHTLRMNDVFDANVGANFARQDYDGKVENNLNLVLNLVYRF